MVPGWSPVFRCSESILNAWNRLWGQYAMEVDNHLLDRVPILVKIRPIEIESQDLHEM